MSDYFDNDREANEEEDELGFSKNKKTAVLEPEDESGEVITADDADFESADNISYDGEDETGTGFTHFEGEEDEMRLQF